MEASELVYFVELDFHNLPVNSNHLSSMIHFLCFYDTQPYSNLEILAFISGFKGPYADHILIPQGSTGSSIFFDIK